MTNQEASRLRAGDRIYWTDPDGGICSDYYLVRGVYGDGVRLTGNSGSEITAVASELSLEDPDC